MIGGMVSSTELTLVVIPAVYALVKGWRLERGEIAAETAHERARAALEAVE
jgi:Cu(I)/Ag(I) efflux system membrane protein CusA/SilA